MVSEQEIKIKKGFQIAKKITKENAKSFYFSSFFLNKTKRKQAYSVYAVCRLSDDAVDNARQNRKKNLEKNKKDINLTYSNQNINSPLLLAFQKTVNDLKIPKIYFIELTQAMEMDLKKTNYKNFNELYIYCYKAAGVVGLIMLYLFGFKDKKAKKYAISLGVAMQLTNILRDIKEDYQRKRIYLPQDELKDFKVNPAQIKGEAVDPNFINLMKFQINRARSYYKEAELGINSIPDWRCRLTVFLMKNIYATILCEIEKNNYNIFKKRAHTSFFDKIFITLSTLLNLKYL